MAESGEISIALTPVQLYAILNGRSISQAELASNSWHEMPGPPRGGDFARLLQPMSLAGTSTYPPGASAGLSRQSAWRSQSHYSQSNPPDCWIPLFSRPLSPADINRGLAVLQIIGGGLETVGGVLLILTPEPTMLTNSG